MLAAEVRRLDDSFDIQAMARILVRPDGRLDVVELRPDGGAFARILLDEALEDPFGRTVTSADGADFVRTLRWASSTDLLWVTPLVDLPDELARDPRTKLPLAAVPHIPSTIPYPEPPPELAGFRVVELRRPRADDYLRSRVIARLVEDPAGVVHTEGPEPAAVLEIDALLDRAGRPPLDRLDRVPLPPGTRAAPLSFEQPGDQAWRDGLVGTRTVADSAGDRATVARLGLEFATLLPRIWMSRCPFTGEVLRLAFDGWGFDGPYWNPARPIRPVDDDVPSTFLGLAGTIIDPKAVEHPEIPAEALGPGWAPVYADVLGDPGVRAVLSAVHVAGLRCDVVAYFSLRRPAGAVPFREWGIRPERSTADPLPTTDLEPLLRNGQLCWVEPFDRGVKLREGAEGCPWLP